MDGHLAPASSADKHVVGPPSDGIHQEIGEQETILFLESADSVVTLNETGSAVWSLCDGTRTVAEIINGLSSAYQVASPEIADDVSALVDQLVEAEFLPD